MSTSNTLPAVMSFDHQVKLAEAFAKSGLFGVKTPEQALALMALCEAEGLHPATAVRDYHIIQGKPAMKAEAMLARFLKNGGKVEWHERTDKCAEATFSHPSGGTVRIKWDLLMAKVAGLAGKEMYLKYPRQLLHARCVSEGVRSVDPQSTGRVYTPEEVDGMQGMKGEVINGVAEEVVSDEEKARIDLYAGRFLDALDAHTEEDTTAQEILKVRDEANKHGIEFFRAVWYKLSSKDRTAIKKYIDMAKENSVTKTAEYLGAMTGEQS